MYQNVLTQVLKCIVLDQMLIKILKYCPKCMYNPLL